MEKIIIDTEKKNNGHTDFTEAFDAIRKHIIAEIGEVVKANDNSCQLCDDGPIVTITRDNTPIIVKITEVCFLGEYLYVFGWRMDEDFEFDDENVLDIEFDEICIEHLGNILDKMHEVGFLKEK